MTGALKIKQIKTKTQKQELTPRKTKGCRKKENLIPVYSMNQ